jgi:hypothetical protein
LSIRRSWDGRASPRRRGRDRGLADPGLAGQQHQPAPAGGRLLDGLAQLAEDAEVGKGDRRHVTGLLHQVLLTIRPCGCLS